MSVAAPRDARALLDARALFALTLALWTSAFLVAAWLIFRHHLRVEVWSVYAAAGQRWSARQPLYTMKGIDDFQYFPQSAMAFALFGRLGALFGGIAWRALGWALLGHAMWRASKRLSPAPAQSQKLYAIASAIVIPPAMTSLFNGQANLYVAALMLQAAVDLGEQRRCRAAAWLSFGLALKPLIAVMLLLACVQYPLLIAPAAISVVVVAALPFVAAPHDYAMAQYRDCLTKLSLSSQPDRLFEDLRGLLWTCGWHVSHRVLSVLRVITAAAAVILCRRVRTTFREPAASMLLFTIAAAYLMLFNARTQANSYVILAPAAALFAAAAWLADRRRAAIVLVAIVACWCGSALPFTAFWLRPVTCLVFCVLLVVELRTRPLREPPSGYAF